MVMNQERSSFSQFFSAFQIILLLLFLYLYIQNNVIGVLQNLHGNDFAHNYVAGYLLSERGNPYDRGQLLSTAASLGIPRLNPYVYPLFVAELFIPLSYFSYPTAQFIWFLLSHLFFIATILIFLSMVPKLLRNMAGLLFLGFSSCFYPIVRTLTAGQLNFLILFLIVLFWKYSLSQKKNWAGFFLGIATFIKIFPGFFILYFLCRKEYRVALSAIVTVVFISFVTILCFGITSFTDYFSIVKAMSYGHSVWSDVGEPFYVAPANQSFHALISRLMMKNPITQCWFDAPVLAKGISIFFSISIIISTLFLAWKSDIITNSPRDKILFCLALLCSLLVPSLFWDHYLVLVLFIPIVLFVYHAETQTFSIGRIIFLSVLLLWFAVPFNYWDESYHEGWNIFWMSSKLYPLLLLFIYLLKEGFCCHKFNRAV
jgi:hypothetical protein